MSQRGRPFKSGEGGRPKGAKNKTTVAAKEAIHAAFEGLGGVEFLIKWAKNPRNTATFLTHIWPKIIPHEIAGEGGRALIVQLRPQDSTL